MLFGVELNPVLVYCIGINFSEGMTCGLIFILFLLNGRKGNISKGVQGTLSIIMGIGVLLWGLAGAIFLAYDYVFPNPTWYSIASIFQLIGAFTVVVVFYGALKPAFREAGQFLLIPILLLILAIYGPYLVISGLSNNPYFLIAGDLVSIFCICLICAYFALNIRKKGVNITKQIIAMAVGWIVLFSGGLLTSEEVVGLFATSALLVQAFGYTLVFIGIVASTLGFWTLPSLNELEWRDQVEHLYLMVKSGIIIYDQSFRGERSLDSNLVAGGITGIASLIQEITSTAGKLEVIQQEGAKILIHPGVYITGVLVVEE